MLLHHPVPRPDGYTHPMCTLSGPPQFFDRIDQVGGGKVGLLVINLIALLVSESLHFSDLSMVPELDEKTALLPRPDRSWGIFQERVL